MKTPILRYIVACVRSTGKSVTGDWLVGYGTGAWEVHEESENGRGLVQRRILNLR